MAILISRLNVGRFRCLNNLKLENLNHINIIAGDNNSGKTSVLEAILLLRQPSDFNNILRVARLRDSYFPLNASPLYESFINLFSRNVLPTEISIEGVCKGERVSLKLSGEQKTIMLAQEELFQNIPVSLRKERIRNYSDGMESTAFIGSLECTLETAEYKQQIEFHSHSRTTGREIGRLTYLDTVYLSPTDHIRGNVFDSIIRDEVYKEICVNLLRQFDPEITDIFYQRNVDTNRTVEYIKHSDLGTMPISTYGDGIKKVLSLASGIARASNGVLLIDELETAIHSRYYDDIFRFVVKACKQFQVQVFITTHNLEAIDGLLATQDYSINEADDISVITVKKESGNKRTYSRILPGRHVYANREEFGFEVRL